MLLSTRTSSQGLLSVAVLACLGVVPSTATAQNLSFIPGDAAFYSTLSKEDASKIANGEGDSVRFSYRLTLEQMSFGPYAGLSACDIVGNGRVNRESLSKLYQHLRGKPEYRRNVLEDIQEDGSKAEIELNPFVVCVVNRDFDIGVRSLCNKYNENWMQDFQVEGIFDDAITTIAGPYCPRIDNKRLVIDDWRHAARVDGLKLSQVPDPGWNVFAKPVLRSITVAAKDVSVYVMDEDVLLRVSLHEDGAECFRIDDRGIFECRWEKDFLTDEVTLTMRQLLL